MRDEIVLAARRAGGNGQVGPGLVAVVTHLLGGEPKPRILPVGRERHDCAADSADEGVDDGSQQRPAVRPCGGSQRQPCQYLGLGH